MAGFPVYKKDQDGCSGCGLPLKKILQLGIRWASAHPLVDFQQEDPLAILDVLGLV